MKWNPITRRQFLQGASGTLALPLLESLLPQTLYAQSSATQKTFIGIAAWNGLFRMFGPTSDLMPRTSPTNGRLSGFESIESGIPHRVHRTLLSAYAAANGGRISKVIDSKFNPYLDKMLMLQGLDYISLGWFHHSSQFGNCADVAGDSGLPATASIDQVMAHSPNFYKNPNLVGRSIVYTASWEQSNYSPSFTFKDPSSIATKLSAGVARKSAYYNPAVLWDAMIGPTIPQANALKGLVVDRVLEDYKSVRAGPRLGAEDRQILDRHISFLHETEKRVRTVSSCIPELRPDHNLSDRSLILRSMNDVIASIISCGLCHSFLGHAMALLSSNADDWHARSHEGYDNDTDSIANQTSYDFVLNQNKAVLEDMCLDLVQKLDHAGQLENSLIVWIQEHNKRGHESWNVPIITFGSAGGVLQTGYYIDYRNFQTQLTLPDVNDISVSRFGFPMAQAYASFLQAVGVPAYEYTALNKASNSSLFLRSSGYGPTVLAPQWGWHHYDSTRWGTHDLNSYLPGIRV